MSTVLTDSGKRVGGYIIGELESATGTYARERGALASGVVGKSGMVCGKVSTGAASSAAKGGGNTGTGTLVLDGTTPVQAGAKAGVYQVRFVSATQVTLSDPNGDIIGTYAIGGANGNSVTVTNELKFALTQAGTVFVIGDGFDVTVVAGSGKYGPLDTSKTNGLQIASAILFSNADASDADTPAVFSVRATEANGAELIWPDGISEPNKAAAIAALKEKGIIVR